MPEVKAQIIRQNRPGLSQPALVLLIILNLLALIVMSVLIRCYKNQPIPERKQEPMSYEVDARHGAN